jgi:hypothetical protein
MQENYVAKFLHQLAYDPNSLPINPSEAEVKSPYNKPSKQLQILLNNDKIILLDSERKTLEEMTKKVIEDDAIHTIHEFNMILAADNQHVEDVAADGNCFFHALSLQTGLTHTELRASAVEYINIHPEQFQGFDNGDHDEYIARMSQNGEWADNLVIQALANHLEMNINIHNLVGNMTQITPSNGEALTTVRLAYTGTHYLAIRAGLQEGTLAPEDSAILEETPPSMDNNSEENTNNKPSEDKQELDANSSSENIGLITAYGPGATNSGQASSIEAYTPSPSSGPSMTSEPTSDYLDNDPEGN